MSSLFGTQEADGAKFAVEQINKSGGIDGKQLSLKIVDDATDPAQGVQNIRGIVADSSVLALLGPTSSSVAVAAQPIVEQSHLVMMAPVSSGSIESSPHKWSFQNFVVDYVSTQAVLKFLKDHGVTKVAMPSTDDAFGQGAVKAFKQYAPPAGMTVEVTTYPPNSTDMSSEVAKMVATHPQGYLAWDSTKTLSTLLKNLRDAVGKGPLVVTPPVGGSATTQQVAGAAGKDIYYLAQLCQDDPRPGLQAKFVADWKAAKNSVPTEAHNLGYTMVTLIAQAMRQAVEAGKPISRQSIRDELETLKDFSTIYGDLTFTPQDHSPLSVDEVQVCHVTTDGKLMRATKSD